MKSTNKYKDLTKEEIDKLIVLRQTISIIYEKEDGVFEPNKVSTTIGVLPEFLRDRESIKRASQSWGMIEEKEYTERGLTPPNYASPMEFTLVEPIEGVRDLPIDKLSDEEIERVIEYYSHKGERTEILEADLSRYYKTARGLTTQMTRGRKRGQNLYSLLTEDEDIKFAKDFEEQGKLLSTLTSGIVVTALENKVIKAIQKHLYAQSRGYGRGEGNGLPEDIVKTNIGEGYDKDETLRDSSFVCIEPYKFTREVLGRDDIGGEDLKRVMGALSTLDGKFAYDDKERAFYRLFTLEKIKTQTEEGAGQVFIACRPIFREGLEKNFINTRTDELQLLSGISSDLSLRLYDILKEVESYRTPTQRSKGYIQMKRTALLERIAVKKSYDNQRKRIESDFSSACEDMVKIGIITKVTEVGENVRFYVSKDWRKIEEETEIATSQES